MAVPAPVGAGRAGMRDADAIDCTAVILTLGLTRSAHWLFERLNAEAPATLIHLEKLPLRRSASTLLLSVTIYLLTYLWLSIPVSLTCNRVNIVD